MCFRVFLEQLMCNPSGQSETIWSLSPKELPSSLKGNLQLWTPAAVVLKLKRRKEQVVERYLTLRQTFFPAWSSGVEEIQEQLSRTLRAPRGRFISTEGQTNTCPQSPSFSLFSKLYFFPRWTYLSTNQVSGLPFLLGLHPLRSATGRRLVASAQP